MRGLELRACRGSEVIVLYTLPAEWLAATIMIEGDAGEVWIRHKATVVKLSLPWGGEW